MKKIMMLVFVLFILFNTNAFATTAVIIKVKDVCEPALGKTCLVGYTNENGVPMTLKVVDYKNKEGASTGIDNTLPDNPFPCPAGYTEYTNYFIPDHSSNNTGLGVIGGVLYVNESNPTDYFYYWVFDTSETFDNYTDWWNAVSTLNN